jgi:SAM-dependent methyltransferase
MYLAGNEGAPPREQLVRAVALVERRDRRDRRDRDDTAHKLRALDVGCGPGREALFLARAGFDVVAVDPYPEMLAHARKLIASDSDAASLEDVVRFERATLEECAATLEAASFDLIHAGFVLPFVLPEFFDCCFAQLAKALRPGGIFCGQFFGANDEFIQTAQPGTMSCHTLADIHRLLTGFELLEVEEINRSGRVGRGREKWWHVFHVTARS